MGHGAVRRPVQPNRAGLVVAVTSAVQVHLDLDT